MSHLSVCPGCSGEAWASTVHSDERALTHGKEAVIRISMILWEDIRERLLRCSLAWTFLSSHCSSCVIWILHAFLLMMPLPTIPYLHTHPSLSSP